MADGNKLILVGNGFDLAHGLKTAYKDFLDWYICKAFKEFCKTGSYNDRLIEIRRKFSGMTTTFTGIPNTIEEVLGLLSSNQYQSINYQSAFLKHLIDHFQKNKWVDIEKYYFSILKSNFENRIIDRKKAVCKLNDEFDFLILELTNYFKTVNENIYKTTRLELSNTRSNLQEVIFNKGIFADIKFVNFNYTETLTALNYCDNQDVIYIHGRVAEVDKNPIIFGYGDESDPTYQSIEDSGQNMYLEHMKSFGYFKTNNYHRLLSYIDSAPYSTYILGHSCGLSDRILLNEIFEHRNCQSIEIFYHRKKDGSDNFKEITQEISRHFKPQNKNIMRRKVKDKDQKNFIPQNIRM